MYVDCFHKLSVCCDSCCSCFHLIEFKCGNVDCHLIDIYQHHAVLYSVYMIQPVVKPVGQPVGCLYTRYNVLSNQLSIRFDNRLHRVNGVLL